MTIDPGWPVAGAVAVLVALTVGAYRVGRLPHPVAPVTAAARAVAQLGLAALVITAVIGSLVASVGLLVLMFAVAVWTTTGRVGARPAWPWAAAAMLAGLVPVVAIVLATGTIPAQGVALIPVVGILTGNTMNGHTLLARRLFDALRGEHAQYEAALSLGLPRATAIEEITQRRILEALIPGLDSVRTAGVVTLPGAFIGVLLGGGTPAQAAAAQVLVLVGIVAAQSVTAVVAARLVAAGRLLPPDLAHSLLP